VVRQFRGKNPQFGIIASVFTGSPLNLFFSGLVSRVTTSLIAHIYPSPYPIKSIIDAHRNGLIEIESWSLYTLEQRLMAGAMGLSFLPANSILDTSLVKENSEDYKIIKDPFDSSKAVGVIKSLQPDISLIHACASDRYGNAILPMPCEDNVWGPRASRGGVILTTERLVSSDYIRAHSALVKLPGYLVKSVSLAPFGSHPIGLFSPDMEKGANYAIDYDFLTAYRKAGQNPEQIKSWLKEWVLDCKNHDDYINKLGTERTASLKAKTLPENQKEKLKSLSLQISNSEATPGEWMTVAACRKITERVLNQEYRTIQAGIGASYLAAAMSYYLLRENDYYIDMATGGGQVGFSPFPGDPSGGSTAGIATCKMLTDSTEAYGTI
ncbi:MAG: CoA transferase, partial [Dehalococcoidia bacterium]|nr:CoA transferase [Dehalococcoidia bacterium]